MCVINAVMLTNPTPILTAFAHGTAHALVDRYPRKTVPLA
jgi:hypothetical protein